MMAGVFSRESKSKVRRRRRERQGQCLQVPTVLTLTFTAETVFTPQNTLFESGPASRVLGISTVPSLTAKWDTQAVISGLFQANKDIQKHFGEVAYLVGKLMQAYRKLSKFYNLIGKEISTVHLTRFYRVLREWNWTLDRITHLLTSKKNKDFVIGFLKRADDDFLFYLQTLSAIPTEENTRGIMYFDASAASVQFVSGETDFVYSSEGHGPWYPMLARIITLRFLDELGRLFIVTTRTVENIQVPITLPAAVDELVSLIGTRSEKIDAWIKEGETQDVISISQVRDQYQETEKREAEEQLDREFVASASAVFQTPEKSPPPNESDEFFVTPDAQSPSQTPIRVTPSESNSTVRNLSFDDPDTDDASASGDSNAPDNGFDSVSDDSDADDDTVPASNGPDEDSGNDVLVVSDGNGGITVSSPRKSDSLLVQVSKATVSSIAKEQAFVSLFSPLTLSLSEDKRGEEQTVSFYDVNHTRPQNTRDDDSSWWVDYAQSQFESLPLAESESFFPGFILDSEQGSKLGSVLALQGSLRHSGEDGPLYLGERAVGLQARTNTFPFDEVQTPPYLVQSENRVSLLVDPGTDLARNIKFYKVVGEDEASKLVSVPAYVRGGTIEPTSDGNPDGSSTSREPRMAPDSIVLEAGQKYFVDLGEFLDPANVHPDEIDIKKESKFLPELMDRVNSVFENSEKSLSDMHTHNMFVVWAIGFRKKRDVLADNKAEILKNNIRKAAEAFDQQLSDQSSVANMLDWFGDAGPVLDSLRDSEAGLTPKKRVLARLSIIVDIMVLHSTSNSASQKTIKLNDIPLGVFDDVDGEDEDNKFERKKGQTLALLRGIFARAARKGTDNVRGGMVYFFFLLRAQLSSFLRKNLLAGMNKAANSGRTDFGKRELASYFENQKLGHRAASLFRISSFLSSKDLHYFDRVRFVSQVSEFFLHSYTTFISRYANANAKRKGHQALFLAQAQQRLKKKKRPKPRNALFPLEFSIEDGVPKFSTLFTQSIVSILARPISSTTGDENGRLDIDIITQTAFLANGLRTSDFNTKREQNSKGGSLFLFSSQEINDEEVQDAQEKRKKILSWWDVPEEGVDLTKPLFSEILPPKVTVEKVNEALVQYSLPMDLSKGSSDTTSNINKINLLLDAYLGRDENEDPEEQ